MQRIVVTLLAAFVVATPLGAQAAPARPTPKDSVKKDSATLAKQAPAQTQQAAGGEVALPKDSAAKKDSTAAKATDSTKAATIRLATFKCKDGTQSFDADSSKACTTNGGVDSVYKKPAPKP
jgi:Ni/Co efflux regulator RcnB